ncbi:LysM peptidoglycan-binding domain-containing protein [Thermocrinis sp.]|uniref:LysM peptidoglycan-binding domain-containing protein n=1 Tax=Thermocrinis sp. TaxID=2024383 RepID=UPI002FDEC02A
MKKKVFILSISLVFNLSFAQECKYHKVKSGETLEKIAKSYGITTQELLKANKSIKPNNLKIGKKICIPISKAKNPGAKDYAIYKVKRGDTLEGIANKFGVDWRELKSFNNLKTTKLSEGQEIKIPARSVSKRTQNQTKDYETYVVQKGGRLEHLAKKLGVSERELERLNPKLKGKWLEKGTVVKVPRVEKREEKETTKYEIYTVKKGGRLEHIAKSLGISKEELEKLNPELKQKWLSKGTKVKVPIKHQKEITENYQTYVVKKTARLEHVAKKLGLSERELERLNPELKDKWLKKGTVVKIPVKNNIHATASEEKVRQPISPQKMEEREQHKETENLMDVKILKNSLPLPVEGEITKNNRGVKIIAECGTPVKAVEEGKVIYSGGDLQAYGNMIILDHGEFISLYANNQKNLVKRGEQVSKNQQIALVGRKNNSENCALYFELRNKEGIPLDPTEYLRNTQ